MKKHFLLILFAFGLFSEMLYAQVPQGIPYQATMLNASNGPLVNVPIVVRFSIIDSIINGNVVYIESHNTTTNNLGLFSLNIGQGIPTSGVFANINWGLNFKFVKVELDTTATGNNYTDLGTQQLMSVPYAFHAKTAESIIGTDANSYTHFVGEIFGGGIVFYVFKDSNGQEHGLVVSLTDTVVESWGPDIDVLNCESTWDGNTNTASILAAGALATDAAGWCGAYEASGYTDWYLPSINEISLLWQNLFLVNRSLANNASFEEINYSDFSNYPDRLISSSEVKIYNANDPVWSLDLSNMELNMGSKSGFMWVRAVRFY